MVAPSPAEVTVYLRRMRSGDSGAIEELLPHVYADLRALADQVFRSQRAAHTLQPTALVHEAYLRMAEPGQDGWNDRQHFMRVAALAMRQLLASYARRRGARKRSAKRVLLEDTDPMTGEDGVDLVELKDCLDELRELNERQAEIVELRFLAGLSIAETADVLGVSVRTVTLDWKMARAWLEQELAGA